MSLIAKFDVEKFDGSNDFGLWRVKMRSRLIQHGWEAALDPFLKTMMDAEKTTLLKTDVYKKAHSALLLCLDNKVLREVNTEDSATGNLSEHIDEFNKLIGDLANINVDIDDEDHALMLLTSLPSSYDNFVDTLLNGRESLTLEDGSGMHSEDYDNGDLLMAEFNSGTILLDDNRTCAIKGTGKGYTVKLQNGRVEVIKGSLMVFSGTMKENYVYYLDGQAKSGEASVGIQEKKSLAQVWHKFLGHISEACLHKQKRREVLGKKGLGSFSGGIDEWLLESGITRHLTVAGTSQQNGLAERMNRTLLYKVSIYSIGEEDTYGFMVRTSGELRDVEDIWLRWDVVFNESLMYKDTLKGAGVADSGKEVEFEVELQGSRNMDNYVLVRDRAKRTTNIPARYKDKGNVLFSRPSRSRAEDDMAAYAFSIIEEEDTHEPITFDEAINSSEKDEWVRAMEEEISSLNKNHTWELVDQPPGQKLVSCKWLYKIKEGIEGV
ncbi:retrovirus-related pol polyprotein from transposon TNT 1-94 [Tanacetum coccineum]|uniref:Retrovirus-related pol polyprotein from transposon TNT 1-94 n=1 Tax=Tanacetum coccineum TaxID=301880 RepID=A0ABQ4YVE6_9ASTR